MKQGRISFNFRTALFIFLSSIIIGSCSDGDHERKFRSALEQAGTNKEELLKVIDHYKKDPADSMKLRAAYFIIENMPGHFSYDTSYLYKYRPVIEKIKILREKGLTIDVIRLQVNPVMDSLIEKYPLSNVYSNIENDLTFIKSKLIISNIDQAFESYIANPFKDSIRFEDFLEYVLPYRAQDGSCLEEWRPFFTQNYALKAGEKFSNVHQLSDSLLYILNKIKVAWRVAHQYPYLKLNDFLISRMTHCPQKCWFNCLLLRSFGIPVTSDFVPSSRVHESGHEWNALRLKDGLYPFDPYWEDSLRYLKAIYAREKLHPRIGPIEHTKVYRKTFKINITELLEHAIRSGEEIPPFFRNPFLKDVTDEYLKTYAIETHVINNKTKADYAYACVFGYNQVWTPVEFGKIKKGKVTFNSMGSVNVYLPSFYQFGAIIPAAYPILLNKDGSSTVLCPYKSRTRRIEIAHVAYQRPELEVYKKSLIGCTIEGANNKNFDNSEVLYKIPNSCEPGNYRVPISADTKYRFVRITVPHLSLVLNEIKFFHKENGAEREIRGKIISSYPKDSTLLTRIVDNNFLTGVDFNSISEEHKRINKVWVGYDFKVPVSISAFEYYFVYYVNIRREGIYELFYWDNEWKSLGAKKTSTTSVCFDDVPENALLMIKIHDTNKCSRIFTYSDGKQHWW
ncbi:MAG: hypothetical protein M0Q53_20445 [Prolixibacteraceae bacterium]|jgi:hypothetical protein|nr:hypothetical protein [Prolixibacteraceae bacterium]